MQSNKISFKGQNIYVGIDVHLKTWHVEHRDRSVFHGARDSQRYLYSKINW